MSRKQERYRAPRDRAGRLYPRSIKAEQEQGMRACCWSTLVVEQDAAGYVVRSARRYYRRRVDAEEACWQDALGVRGRVRHYRTGAAEER